MPFKAEVAEAVLVKSARCCSICRRFKGVKIEVHHVVQEADGGSNDVNNAIPLCFDCHTDVGHYNDHHPRGRKYRPSELFKQRDAWFELVASGKAGPQIPWPKEDPDVRLMRFYRECLSRPAFEDPYLREGSYVDFDKAIEDTITAFNTGALKDRKTDVVLKRGRGVSHLQNVRWLDRMETIVQLLRAIRKRYAIAERDNQHQSSEVGQWMDHTRHEVINVFNIVATEAGIAPIQHH